MTASVMLYSLLVAALIGAAALLSERIAAELKRPRRFVWLAAMILSLVLPTYAVLNGANGAVPSMDVSWRIAIASEPIQPPELAAPSSSSAVEIDTPFLRWPGWDDFSPIVIIAWIVSTAAVLLFHAFAWLALRRKVARAETRRVEGVEVRILDEYGPAVFGFFRPQIILPRWLCDANVELRKIVLRHELEHIAARDQLTLLAALVVVAAAPWNVALWWQLWRLRFALEIDCDARVLRGATPDTPYAEALLEVQQRRTRMPIAAVALIEPVSQLERRIRIMMSRQNPSRRAVLGVCAPAAAAFVLAACAVNAPDAAAPMKPPPPFAPDGMGLVADTFRIVMERHGTELRNNERRVAEVALFFDESGSLVRSTIETMDDEPPMPTPASQGGPSGYLAFCLEKLEGKPGCAIDPTTNLTMHAVRIELYGSIDNVVDGGYSEDVDRRLAERYFADIFSAPPTENSSYWVLLDSAGTPLAAGREMLRTLKELGPPATQMQEALEQRYPQAEIQGASLTLIRDRQSRTVTDRGGRNVMLYSAWLSADSPLPAAAP